MNADRIIVVTGGEVVEQGNHEDLIRANGKYAELWSKQIFAKPPDTDPPEDSKPVTKSRKAPNIVNDLSPEATSSELAKVKPTANGKATTNGWTELNGSTKTDDKSASSSSAEHKKEV